MKDLHRQQHDQTVIKRQGGHTPGPWLIQDNGWNEDNPPIQDVWIYSDATPAEKAVVESLQGTSRADARLIAAAPDLLEIVEMLHRFVSDGAYTINFGALMDRDVSRDGEEETTLADAVKAAIATATGSTDEV